MQKSLPEVFNQKSNEVSDLNLRKLLYCTVSSKKALDGIHAIITTSQDKLSSKRESNMERHGVFKCLYNYLYLNKPEVPPNTKPPSKTQNPTVATIVLTRGDPSPLCVHLVAGICGAYAAGAPARGASLAWGRSFGDVMDHLML